MMRRLGGLLCLLAAAFRGPGAPSEEDVRDYLAARAKSFEKEFLPEVKTSADFEKARPRLRQQYLDMLGLWPLPDKTPLAPVITGTLEEPGVTIEKLHFQSRPGLYVTANLYLPRPAQGPYPAVLYSCGHYNGGRDGNKTACQEHGLWFAAHGYVCLVYDTLQLGEIAAIHHGTYRYGRWWWHSAGYTPAGVECWNAIRGIDYLQSRPEVDPARIGATGISGGGAATFWISAADERIRISAPVSGMSDLTWYVGDHGVDGHCDCMFLYNSYHWNWTQIAALICPRPLLFVNSDSDTIFPMPANERIINRLKRLYSKYGESDQVGAIVSVGGHAYRTDIRRAIFEFFNRHLKGDARRVEDADSGLGPQGKPRIQPRDLRVFPEDKDLPADQLNTKIDETFVPRGKVELPEPDGFEAWSKGLVARLGASGLALAGEPRVGVLSSPRPAPGTPDASVLWVGDPWPRGVPESSWSVRLPSEWTRKNPPNTIERSFAILGMTADSYRLQGLLQYLESQKGPIDLVGSGATGVIAAYAALFCPKVREVTIVDPPASHREGPYFLGVLKICDIPEALGCLAPRPLTLVHAADAAFDRTAELYRRAGAPDKFVRK